MDENKKIPEFNSYVEMAEFWDSHSLTESLINLLLEQRLHELEAQTLSVQA